MPGGYSLVDYKEPEILSYCKGLKAIDTMSWGELIDWGEIANSYPRSRERLVKDQSSVHQLVDKKIRAIRRDEAQRMFVDTSDDSVESTPFALLGVKITRVVAAALHLKSSFISGCEQSRQSAADLQSIEGWSRAGQFDSSRFLTYALEVFEVGKKALVERGMRPVDLMSAEDKLQRGLREVGRRTWCYDEPVDEVGTGWEKRNGLTLLVGAFPRFGEYLLRACSVYGGWDVKGEFVYAIHTLRAVEFTRSDTESAGAATNKKVSIWARCGGVRGVRICPRMLAMDLDGVIVDTFYVHQEGWVAALATLGIRSNARRI